MSMLADRKIKQKWALNPRGKAWSEDSNKFGQKMLEKMGWSRGKGLGAKENGVIEHVKLTYKNDSKGMGYKDTNTQWTEHDSNFNALLQSLSGQTEVESEIKILSSLEKKSQSSKVRVHYKKFTRGKDLSRCTEKDLANIFGKKSFNTPTKNDEENLELKNDTFSTNGGSMVDYFKKKLPNFGKTNGYVVGSNGVLKKGSESEEETFTGFGFKPEAKKSGEGLSNPAFDPLFGQVEVRKHVLNTIEEEDKEPQMEEIVEEVKKKKKRDRNHDNSPDDGSDVKKKKRRKEADDCQNGEFEVRLKKKKNRGALAIDNPIFDDCQNGDCQAGYVNGEFEVKRKKKSRNDNLNFNCQSDEFEVKRKNGDAMAIDNPNFDDRQDGDCQTSYVNEEFEVKRKKSRNDDCQNAEFEVKRRKKKNRGVAMAIDNPNFDDCQNEQFEVKTRNGDAMAIDNPNFDDRQDGDCQTSYVNEEFEVKRKKKSRNGNLNFGDCQNGDCQTSYVNEEFEVKRKKKSRNDNLNFDDCQSDEFEVKRKNGDAMAIDKPNFDDRQTSYVKEEFEVKRKKKNKGVAMAIDNPTFDDRQNGDCQTDYVNEEFEVKRSKKSLNFDGCQNGNHQASHASQEFVVKRKKKHRDGDPSFDDSSANQSSSFEIKRKKKNKKSKDKLAVDNPNFKDFEVKKSPSLDEIEPQCDLILNITSTPTLPKPPSSSKSKQSTKRRKSVRFSNITEERIIPNNEDLHASDLIDNRSYQVNLDEIEKKIDGFQAEIENDINEAKCQFIGEVGNPAGDNEKLPEGTKLKFRHANFGIVPFWGNKASESTAKKSYKHLIKGDIILGFNNTNLHEIGGYARQIDSKM